MDYAAIARTMGCGGIHVEDPEALSPALRQGMEERDRPTVIDVVVTHDPAQMLPAVDNRTVEIKRAAIGSLDASAKRGQPPRVRRIPLPGAPGRTSQVNSFRQDLATLVFRHSGMMSTDDIIRVLRAQIEILEKTQRNDAKLHDE